MSRQIVQFTSNSPAVIKKIKGRMIRQGTNIIQVNSVHSLVSTMCFMFSSSHFTLRKKIQEKYRIETSSKQGGQTVSYKENGNHEILHSSSYFSLKFNQNYNSNIQIEMFWLVQVVKIGFLTIRAKHAVRIPLPDPTSRALAPSCNCSDKSSRAYAC